MTPSRITSPDSPALDELGRTLGALAAELEDGAWPTRQLELLAACGVFEWFLPSSWGGQAWDDSAVTHGFLRLGAACLTTSFILTQRTGACTRLVASENPRFRARFGPGLCDGGVFATVAVSHLTTSRRHLSEPILRAVETPRGFRLDGYSVWVTGAAHADVIVVGADLADGRQVLLAVETEWLGVHVAPPERLLSLNASHTGRIEFCGVDVPGESLVAGPAHDVLRLVGGGAGGLQTSALAVGLADAAITYIEQQVGLRTNLAPIGAALRDDWSALREDLLRLTAGDAGCSREELRSRANSLALRATQASLGAAKGAGFVNSHPAGRWCREALFFLVWSCPQAVLEANLCQLAMLETDG